MEKGTIEYFAKLARLELDSRELDLLAEDMTSIIALMDTIKEINISEINESYDFTTNKAAENYSSSLRSDDPEVSMEAEDILKNAAIKLENAFVVPKVVE